MILAYILAVLSLLVIPYCHISVYFVCRRHTNQIKSEKVLPDASAKFLAEKKAWKNINIIIGCVFMCYVPGRLRGFINSKSSWFIYPENYLLAFSYFILSSLCNPIIYWLEKQRNSWGIEPATITVRNMLSDRWLAEVRRRSCNKAVSFSCMNESFKQSMLCFICRKRGFILSWCLFSWCRPGLRNDLNNVTNRTPPPPQHFWTLSTVTNCTKSNIFFIYLFS